MNNINELKKNRLKITSNPYAREIQYAYWDSNISDWVSPANTSNFKNEKFTKAAVYHKAYDIIETALKSYGGNVGLDIYFEGTADDFNYLNEIVDKYFYDKEIKIQKGGKYLPVVTGVKRDIDTKFKDVEDMFEKYPSNSAAEKVKKFRDTMSDTIPICVMGLYSTGKSAFINSLLGVEILPSADDPTTAKTFKISVGPGIRDYTISFKYQDESTPKTNAKLEVYGNKFKINIPKTSSIVSKLDDQTKYDSEYDRMYNALKHINEFDKDFKPNDKLEWRVSPLVEVNLPLKKSYTSLPIDKYDFVIYDTPGSNSASNVNHNKVLKDAMKEQTNGLPVYVITSKNMDSDSNKELMKTLDELGNSLDRNNLMVIVNQADDPEAKSLANKKTNFDSLAVHKLNPAGTYFVSSIMGLGSKLLMTKRSIKTEVEDDDTGELKIVECPCFIDLHYLELFKKNKPLFVSKRNPKSLYSYNIIPKPEFDRYKNSVKLEGANDRIFHNSGLDAVCSAITNFAENYSLYNKCRNAVNYLTEAFNLLTDEIEGKKQEQERLNEKLDCELTDTSKCIIKKLEDAIKYKKSEFQKSLADALAKEYKSNRSSLTEKRITADAQVKLDECTSFFFKKDEFAGKMEDYLKAELTSQWDNFKRVVYPLWGEQTKNLKEVLIQIITATPLLTPEQKEILNKKIKDINVQAQFDWNIKLESKDIIKGLFWHKIKKEITPKCLYIFDQQTAKAIDAINTQWSNSFGDLQSILLNKSKSVLSKHNPEMIKIQKKIKKCQEDIGNLDKQKKIVSYKISEIKELTQFKTKSEDEE